MDEVGRPTVHFKTDLEKLFQRDISRALESLPVKLKEDQVKILSLSSSLPVSILNSVGSGR